MKKLAASILFATTLSVMTLSAQAQDGAEVRIREPKSVEKSTQGYSNDTALARVNSKLAHHITPEVLLERARIFAEKRDWTSALVDLDNSLSMKKQLQQAYYLRAYVRYELGDYEKSEADYVEYLKTKPENEKAWISLAAVYEALNNNDKALDALNHAVAVNPKDLLILANKADLLGRMNRYEDAISTLNSCLQIDPNCHVCQYERAFLKEAVMHDDQGALKDLDALIASGDNYPKVFLERAFVRQKVGNLDGAKADYDTLIQQDPKNDLAYAERAALEFERGQYANAVSDYTRALKITPQRVDLLVRRAEAYRYLNDWENAKVDSAEALRINPGYADAFLERGYTFLNECRPTDARADFDQVISLQPTKSAAYFARAFTYLETADYDNAAADFKQVVTNGNNDESKYSYVYLALMQKMQQANNDMKDTLSQAEKKIDSKVWPSAAVEFLQGKIKEDELTKAADSNEKQAELHCFLALNALAAEDRERAAKEFDWVKKHGDKRFFEYSLADTTLSRLDFQ